MIGMPAERAVRQAPIIEIRKPPPKRATWIIPFLLSPRYQSWAPKLPRKMPRTPATVEDLGET